MVGVEMFSLEAMAARKACSRFGRPPRRQQVQSIVGEQFGGADITLGHHELG